MHTAIELTHQPIKVAFGFHSFGSENIITFMEAEILDILYRALTRH